jgi:hypothetical protein
MNRFIPTVVYLVTFLASLAFHDMSRLLIGLISITALISIIDKLGKGIALRESIAMLYIITCLVMPVLGYDYYNSNFFFARIYKFTMRVPETVYFPYVLPAVSAFCFTLTFPIQSKVVSDDLPLLENILSRIRAILDGDKYVGISIMGAGLLSFLVWSALPVSVQYFSIVLFFACYASLLYIYYTPNRANKKGLILFFAAFVLYYSISVGMFTLVVYMSITISSFFLVGLRMQLWKKVSILASAIFIVVVMQATKTAFRAVVSKDPSVERVEVFAELFVDNLTNSKVLFEPNAFWQVYLRMNQGLIISNVMNRFPLVKPHDGGDVLLQSLLASFIPRIFWPDKPTADGRFNMRYFAGMNLNKRTSMNVGPIGEAYGSFGPIGGIAFMAFIGFAIRWIYGLIFALSRTIPLIIFWIPVLFFQITYSAETDTMQIFNSTIKISIIMALLYVLLPWWFGRAKPERPSRLVTSPAG